MGPHVLQFVEFRWRHLSVPKLPVPQRYSSCTHRPPLLTALFWSPRTRFIWIYFAEITREQEGLRVSTAPKPLVPLHVHFPETLKETHVYLHIHNSDIARLVRYLFLTAESFWGNWANTSATYRGEAEDWRAIHPSEQSSHVHVFLLVLEEVLFVFAG